jgi:hypothetical protein
MIIIRMIVAKVTIAIVGTVVIVDQTVGTIATIIVGTTILQSGRNAAIIRNLGQFRY